MLYRIISILRNYWRKFCSLKYRLMLGHMGKRSMIISPMSIDNPKSIFIGSNVLIQQNVWLAACPTDGNQKATLTIKDDTTIGHFNHIYSTGSITIEKGVLTADRVYIGDVIHPYSDITKYIKQQKAENIGKTTIGEGSWIGEGASIVGANIGKHCVIGTNAVVLSDIPDYSVAVGVPAKVIKRYSFESKRWENLK